MDISIIGAGNVGQALARRFVTQNIHVTFAVRNPEDPKYLPLKNMAHFTTTEKLSLESDFTFLAVPWTSVPEVAKRLPYKEGQIICDCTNPLTRDLEGLQHDDGLSGAEKIASLLPGAKILKAFNHTGASNIENPFFEKGRPLLFVAGEHKDSKDNLIKLIEKVGFRGVDAGSLSASKHLENLALFWIHMAYKTKVGPGHSLSLLEKF
tara:strand:+ start:526 stop:1149 length:624 start_codon:yes stop_codon:yes gene_type:complete